MQRAPLSICSRAIAYEQVLFITAYLAIIQTPFNRYKERLGAFSNSIIERRRGFPMNEMRRRDRNSLAIQRLALRRVLRGNREDSSLERSEFQRDLDSFVYYTGQ